MGSSHTTSGALSAEGDTNLVDVLNRTHLNSHRQSSEVQPPPHTSRSILGFNLWAQLYALAAMCRGPYLCSSLRFLPVIAPPTAFRVGGPGARYYQVQLGGTEVRKA